MSSEKSPLLMVIKFLTGVCMVAEAIIREAELMGDEPEEVLRHVASRIKHRAKEAKQDER